MNSTTLPYITSLDIAEYQKDRDIPDSCEPTVPPVVYVAPNSTMDFLLDAFIETEHLTKASVKKQAQETIRKLSDCIQNRDLSSRRLPKPCITEESDFSCLLEWNFENFRFGFSFEEDESMSFYFFVLRDDSIGRTESVTNRINGNIVQVISKISDFVIGNT